MRGRCGELASSMLPCLPCQSAWWPKRQLARGASRSLSHLCYPVAGVARTVHFGGKGTPVGSSQWPIAVRLTCVGGRARDSFAPRGGVRTAEEAQRAIHQILHWLRPFHSQNSSDPLTGSPSHLD